ncbi:WXG100 family type VII secretion target [Cellulomonas sp. PS-H5]|uniref:WXG100 family type VII secretion target n=1 Tax=Cellulomonas sp. PS-H5 TaxID=2820400 RepID=UPI001C4E2F04|nr:hypothetical protein [Cellulomonas sp. PS-H5]MBW0252534.1 hypothetical protein [Cellulomonas sp. PS-H5]
MSDPSRELVVPVPSAPIPDFVETVMNFPDLISPSYWLLRIIQEVCGTDPVAWVAEHFSGDWERMSTASSALEHLGEYHEAMAVELRHARETFRAGWTGEAAEAASAYFSRLEDAVNNQAGPLRDIAREVDNVAQGMKSTQATLESLMGMMLDWALAAAVSAAAAAASSWTVVGGIVGGGATAFSIAQAARTWMQVVQVHGNAVAMMNGVVGLSAGFLGSIHGFSTQPLPSGSYTNRQLS